MNEKPIEKKFEELKAKSKELMEKMGEILQNESSLSTITMKEVIDNESSLSSKREKRDKLSKERNKFLNTLFDYYHKQWGALVTSSMVSDEYISYRERIKKLFKSPSTKDPLSKLWAENLMNTLFWNMDVEELIEIFKSLLDIEYDPTDIDADELLKHLYVLVLYYWGHETNTDYSINARFGLALAKVTMEIMIVIDMIQDRGRAKDKTAPSTKTLRLKALPKKELVWKLYEEMLENIDPAMRELIKKNQTISAIDDKIYQLVKDKKIERAQAPGWSSIRDYIDEYHRMKNTVPPWKKEREQRRRKGKNRT